MKNQKTWNLIVQLIADFHVPIRLSTVYYEPPSQWSPWLAFPSEFCVEVLGLGVTRKCDVTRVEISHLEHRSGGRGVPVRVVDHSERIVGILKHEGIAVGDSEGLFSRILMN